MEITQEDISFHSNEIKKELQTLKEILKKTSENPAVASLNHLNRVQNSQITNTSNYLTKFLKNCRRNPEVFSVLSQKSLDHDIFIRIPETLLYSSHGRNPIFLFNSEEGFICSDTSDNSIDNFFSFIQKTHCKRLKYLPLFVHKSKGGGNRLYFDAENARKGFEECPYRYHILQRYIQVSSRMAWKVSVDWLEGGLKYFTLVNNLPFQPARGSLQLFEKNENNAERFMVNCKDLKSYHIVASLQPISDLARIAKNIAPVINKLLFKHKTVNEIVLDFVKDLNGNWIFLAVQGCLLKGEASSISNPKKLTPLNPKFTIYPTISYTREKSLSSPEDLQETTLSKVENRRISKISRKIFRQATKAGNFLNCSKFSLPTPDEEFSIYLKQKSSDQEGRIPFNMIGIVPQKLGSRLTYFVEDKREMVPKTVTKEESRVRSSMSKDLSVKSNSDYLEKISKKLDEMTGNFHKKPLDLDLSEESEN